MSYVPSPFPLGVEMGRFDEVEDDRRENMMKAQTRTSRPGLKDVHEELHDNLNKLDDLINELVDRLDGILLPEETRPTNSESKDEAGFPVSQAVDFVNYRVCDVRKMQDKVLNLTHRVNL